MTQTRLKTDREIQKAVIEELTWDKSVGEAGVGVQVDRGTVILTGVVESYAIKIAAQEAAHRVAGVLDVANDLDVQSSTGLVRTDKDIAQAIRSVLEWDVMIPHENIETTVANGWVTLTGQVPFWFDRQHAERAVRNLMGVRGVINQITVASEVRDAQLVGAAIEQALERRAERESERIRVEVSDGIVSLTGRVHNWSEKQAILGAAGHAAGVRRVEDHLRIDPYF